MKPTTTLLSGAILVASVMPGLAFELSSPDIKAGEAIAQTFAFNGFGCTGNNLSPALTWRGAPEGTKSFALMVHDPDAKSGGGGFWHWVVTDIPASATEIPQGAGDGAKPMLPEGARQINTDFGAPGWGGPCPPQGEAAHRYNFTLYALNVDKLELPDNPTASLTGFMANAHALGSATLTATYGR